MGLLLVLAFIVVPIAELYVIIQVGEAIGVFPTLLLLLLDAFLGSWLLKREGRAAWRRFNKALAERRMPGNEVADGFLVILGGALLIAPGFITDIFGVLFLIPPTRAVARRILHRFTVGRVAVVGFPGGRRRWAASGVGRAAAGRDAAAGRGRTAPTTSTSRPKRSARTIPASRACRAARADPRRPGSWPPCSGSRASRSDASAAQVWSLIAEPRRWHEWSPYVAGGEGLGDPEVEAGAKGAVVLRGGVRIGAEILDVVPGASWTWQVKGLRIRHEVSRSSTAAAVDDDPRWLRALLGPGRRSATALPVALIARNIARVASRR